MTALLLDDNPNVICLKCQRKFYLSDLPRLSELSTVICYDCYDSTQDGKPYGIWTRPA